MGWNVPSNWGGTVPSGTDAALFNLGAYTYQPNLTAPASVGVLWNTGSGSLAITGSALTINSATINGNASTGIEMDPGAGALTISSSLALGGSQTWLNNSSNVFTVAGNVANGGNTLTIAGSGSTTISGGIGGSGGFTKIGAGLLTMTGSNTYSGTTTVNQGTLKLDFSAAGAPANNVINNSAINSALTLGGGNLVIQGKAGAASSQSFNGLTVGAGASSLAAISGAGGSTTVSLGAITRYVGGTIDFTLPASGGIATTQTTNGPGVMVDASSYWTAYATVNGGSTWATISDGQIVGLTTYSYTNAFPEFYVGTTLITQSLSPGNGAAYTGAITFNTRNTTMTLTGVNWLASDGGLLVTPSATGTVITGGSIQCGGGNSLILFDYGSLSVASAIVDNSAGSTLTFSGTGTTTLTGTNTFSGTTYINNGAMVQLGNGGNTGTLGLANIFDNGTLVFSRSNNVVQATDFGGPISGVGSVIQNGGGRLVFNANNTYTGATTISAGTLQLGDGVSSNGSVGGNIADNSTLAFANPTAQTFSGTISGSGQVAILGPGQLALSGSNTYTGPTTVNQGRLVVDGALTNSAVSVNGGTLGGSGHLSSVSVSASGQIAPGDALGTQMSVSGNLSVASGAVMDYELDTPSTSDTIACGSLTLNQQQFSAFNFTWTANFGPGNYDLIESRSLPIGSLGTTTTGTVDGYPARLAVQNNDLVLTVVPEPSTATLLGACVAVLMGCAWRRRVRVTHGAQTCLTR
jgi:autotransporter-associated beta strand protein